MKTAKGTNNEKPQVLDGAGKYCELIGKKDITHVQIEMISPLAG